MIKLFFKKKLEINKNSILSHSKYLYTLHSILEQSLVTLALDLILWTHLLMMQQYLIILNRLTLETRDTILVDQQLTLQGLEFYL